MTAFAFILGVVPLVIATGPGAEMRRSLGTAVFSGMLGVTIIGLFLTPVFYVVLRKLFPVRVRPANRWLKASRVKTVPGIISETKSMTWLFRCNLGLYTERC